jgi:hypothetical protein
MALNPLPHRNWIKPVINTTGVSRRKDIAQERQHSREEAASATMTSRAPKPRKSTEKALDHG